MFTDDKISFRRLQRKDLPLLHRWLNNPHIHEWYDKEEDQTLSTVSKEYSKKITGEESIKSYIVLYDNKAVAYMQTYRAGDWAEFSQITGYSASDTGIDLFIGESEFMERGFGTMMLKKFLEAIIITDPNIHTCFLDPEPDNKRAIRAHEKAGFTYVKTVQIPSEPNPAYLMEIKIKIH